LNQRKPSRRLQYQRILGSRLHSIRSAKKIDRSQLVDRYGFSHAMLCKIEAGRRGPSPESLLTLCDAFGVDVFGVLVDVAEQYRAERFSLDIGEYHFASPELRQLDALALYQGFPEHRLPAGPIQPIGAAMPDEKPISEMTTTELLANQLDQEPVEEQERIEGSGG
jgi:transcriptional regulator with XRE-family HTH domain